MKKMTTVGLAFMLAGCIASSYADYVTSEGFLTESNNWNKSVFDNTLNPAAGTSTGENSDFIAGNRTMQMASDYATFSTFALGTDGGGGSNASGGHLEIFGGTLSATNITLNVNTVKTGLVCSVTQTNGTVLIDKTLKVGRLGGASYEISGGILTMEDLIIAANTTKTTEVCSVTQSGGTLTVNDRLDVGQQGAASLTVSGGSFSVGGAVYLNQGLAGHEHTFAVEGQAASAINIAGNFLAGAGSGAGYQNVSFKLGETGITPITIGGSFFADAQTEIIVDGADYTGGVQTITLATYSNNEDGVGVVQTFLNFNTYLPELIFANGSLKLDLTLNPHPELLLDNSFEELSGTEPNTNSAPWFSSGEEGGSPNFSITPDTTWVRTGDQSVKFSFYFDAAAMVQNVDKTLESGESYEFSVWNLLADPSTGASHTNLSEFTLSIWTSAVKDGTYSFRKGLFGNLATTTNEYQQFTYAFTSSTIIDGGASLGEYIQVRIAKANPNTKYKIYFDDASLKTVESVDNSYASWSNSWGVAIGSEDEDYDNDGQINLYEYAQGGNPTNGFVNGRLPTFDDTGSGLEYVYAQRTDDPALVYNLETTLTLVPASWTNDGYTVVATNLTGGTFDYVTNSIPTFDDEKFIRLNIEN